MYFTDDERPDTAGQDLSTTESVRLIASAKIEGPARRREGIALGRS